MLRFLGVMGRSLCISWERAKQTVLILGVGCCQEKLWKELLKLGMCRCHERTFIQRCISSGRRQGPAWSLGQKGGEVRPTQWAQPSSGVRSREQWCCAGLCVSHVTAVTSVVTLRLDPQADQAMQAFSAKVPERSFIVFSAPGFHSGYKVLDLGVLVCWAPLMSVYFWRLVIDHAIQNLGEPKLIS